MRQSAHKACQRSKPDILSVLKLEGVALKQRGRTYWGCCPLHSEKKPSFKVDPDRQTFYCFGCHKHGDALTLVMELHGLSFKEAFSYLNIERGRPDPAKITEDMEKRELVEAFRAWEKETGDCIALCLRTYRHLRATRTVYTEAELVIFAQLQGQIDYLEYLYEEVFCKSDDEAKLQIFKEELGI